MNRNYSPYTADMKYRGTVYSFAFDITFTDEQGFRAYIRTAPSYGSRSDSLSSTHRLRDNGRCYICWNSTISSLSAMKAVIQLWTTATVMYIADGGTFETHASRIRSANFN